MQQLLSGVDLEPSLAWLLHPLAVEPFLNEVWGTTSYHVSRNSPGYFDHLLDGSTSVDELVGLFRPDLSLVCMVREDDIKDRHVYRLADGRFDAVAVGKDFGDGYTIVLERAQRYVGTLTSLARRSVPFPMGLADELAALMVGKGRDDLVFTDQRGGVLRNSNWRARVFEPAVAKCRKGDESFPAITPHDLRHTAASLAISAGANVKAVQRMLGHAKASMTLDVYADLFDDDLDSVAANLDAAISKALATVAG